MSKKGTIAAVVFSALLIVLLIGLGIRIWFDWQETVSATDEISAQSSDSVMDELSAANHPDENPSESEFSDETGESLLSLIWVGDSRTLGMRDALADSEPSDDIFIGAAGEGYEWLSKDGVPELEKTIKSSPDCPVVMNMGVNDYENIDNYLTLYSELAEEYPDTDFYFLSVYPVDDEAELTVTNENIDYFNSRIKTAYPDTYIDCCSYLNDEKIEPFDGVHYEPEEYLLIYEYVRNDLEDNRK